ncbi:MAG: protein-L-isoaspartate(D-aspartate) O-methyltransferase [Cyanobacteria bacterium]|nr:protein-L-isoaspartate(D-aspartate) O-methyltransferase [Cyanobacteriota bacterium]
MTGERSKLLSWLLGILEPRRHWSTFSRLLGSLTLAGLVSTNASGCAQDTKTNSSIEAGQAEEAKLNQQRQAMIDDIRTKGVRDEKVLHAVSAIPRHLFVPKNIRDASYEDGPLPIGQGQTISQPYIVAYMTEALGLTRDDKVLEIGTGSGYQAAVLSQLVKQVYSIEVIPELARVAKETLLGAGIENVHVRTGDGYKGWPEQAPFDAIILTAAPKELPPALVDQLAEGGRMVAPVGGDGMQWLIRLVKRDGKIRRETMLPVRFVPMVPKKALR